LLPNSAVGAVVYVEPDAAKADTHYKVSLRSIGSGEREDTTRVSAALGGGGHANASSFFLAKQELDEWRAKE
jgi:nanoRNase/pAp phosphatase (c-di-AMP/oligoRNAs hydrolase)